MDELLEFSKRVRDEKTFLEFLEKLRAEVKECPEKWQKVQVEEVIESAFIWLKENEWFANRWSLMASHLYFSRWYSLE
jgi:hypothetical protein